MRYLAFIFILLFAYVIQAQDKLFYQSGQMQKGVLVSITKDAVYFKSNDSAAIQKIKKTELIMVENYRGVRYIFGGNSSVARAGGTDTAINRPNTRQNSIGAQPLAMLVGRATVVYERYTKNDKIGFVIPVSLTFDPFGLLYGTDIDTSITVKRIRGVSFIFGGDVNFYFGKSERSRFFVGPRIRYGTDLFLRGTEAYSLQTQAGWKHEDERGKFIQHFSLGFGFVRILGAPGGLILNPKQSYGWYSINYRLSLRW